MTAGRDLAAGGFGPREFAAVTGISRETLARFEAYAALLVRWQKAMGLVAGATLPDLWRRHMLDSAQLYPLLPPGTRVVVDLGSGAGFPGLVLALLGVPEVHLIEANQRKAAFLGEAARQLAVAPVIHAARAEAVPPVTADAITARALAPLAALLPLAARFAGAATLCLFPKGANAAAELAEAARSWTMTVERVASRSDPSGTILAIRSIARAGAGGVRH